MKSVKGLQRDIYENYARDLKLDSDAAYMHGTWLRPVVPLDTAVDGLFVLGAYPSARFAVVNGVSDVPVADNLGPFESERWFDGRRVRKQASARELEDLFLSRLGVERESCWITDLVKVFLFKDGHVTRYRKLGAAAPEGYVRDRFFDLGRGSVSWLEKELKVARPRFVITLGAEVAGVLHGVRSQAAQTRLLVPEVVNLQVGDFAVPAMHCAHPGILMRRDSKNPWPARHETEFIPALEAAKKELSF